MIPAFTRHSSQAANVRALFAAGEKGVWYDPSDLSSMYSDRAGTTLVTGVESPVGKILDKSGNGFHATASADANRPTLSARYNLLVDTETLATQSVTTVATTYTLKFTGTGTITLSGTKTGTYSQGTTTLSSVTAGTLTLTVSGTVTQADLRVSGHGTNLPAYQRVTTSTDYGTVGFPKYLSFNGTSSAMVTGSINFSGGDKMTVHAGVRKLSDAARGTIVEFSTSPFANSGVFASEMPSGFLADFSFGSKGTTSVYVYAASSAPISKVLTGLGNISGDSAILRLNGTQAASIISDQGSGNYGNYNLFIGARNTNQYWVNGHIYSLIIRAAQSTATQIANAETYVNTKCGKLY